MPQMAQRRTEIFPPDLVQVSPEGACLKAHALYRLLKHLTGLGLPAASAICYVESIWRAGENLDYRVSAHSLSKELGEARSTTIEKLQFLMKLGLLVKLSAPKSRAPLYSFPAYQEVVQIIKTYDNK